MDSTCSVAYILACEYIKTVLDPFPCSLFLIIPKYLHVDN